MRQKVSALIQARMGSTRLPGKAMMKIQGKTIIQIIFERLQHSKEIDDIILSTSSSRENNSLVRHAKEIGLKYYRGSENDLVARHLGAANKLKANAVLRVTGDCPLVDPHLADQMIRIYRKKNHAIDFMTNAMPPTYPDGLDLDIMPLATLKKLEKEIKKNDMHRDFFVPYIMKHKDRFKVYNFANAKNLSSLRWTLDYPEDFSFLEKIFSTIKPKENIFFMDEVLALVSKNPKVLEINKKRMDNVILSDFRSQAYHSLAAKTKFIIIDFDRTLVDLNVNWQKVKEEVVHLYQPFLIYPNSKKHLFERLRHASSLLQKKKGKNIARQYYQKSLAIVAKEEMRAAKKAKLIKGAKDFLQWLEKNRLSFAILSNNTNGVIRYIFKKYQLPKPRMIIGSNDVTYQKPNPEGLGKIVAAQKLKKDQCVLVGDSNAEIELGKKTNVATFTLTTYYRTKKISHDLQGDIVENFNELKKRILA